VHEHPRQRDRRAGAPRRGAPHRALHRERPSRAGNRANQRQRLGDFPGQERAHLPSRLHHERKRHGSRYGDLAKDGGGSRRDDGGGGGGGSGEGVPDPPAASGEGLMPGRVLIVDDEKGMRLALRSLLGKEGYEVDTAESGEEALRRIGPGSFHVVITDLSLQDTDGMAVLEHARRVDPDAAGVLITAYRARKNAGATKKK